MRTPERHRSGGPGSALEARSPDQPAPLEPARDLGTLIALLSATGALLGSWTLFPHDAVGMWAGYWVSGSATVAVLGCMWLRSTLPTAAGVAFTALSGGVLAFVGALGDRPAPITAVMVAGGAGITVGALLQAGRRG